MEKEKWGEYLEPMADLTSLTIAPMVFVFIIYQHAANLYVLSGIIIFFFICSFIRLGSFHILKDEHSFVGLPASASTIIVLVAAFVQFPVVMTALLVLCVSLLMISPFRFPKPQKTINAIAALLILGAIILGDAVSYGGPLLLFGAVCVILSGTAYLRFPIKK